LIDAHLLTYLVVSSLVLISEVAVHCARLLLEWVTVCRQINQLGM